MGWGGGCGTKRQHVITRLPLPSSHARVGVTFAVLFCSLKYAVLLYSPIKQQEFGVWSGITVKWGVRLRHTKFVFWLVFYVDSSCVQKTVQQTRRVPSAPSWFLYSNDIRTPCHFLTAFRFNIPCRYSPLLNLRPLIFDFTSVDWIRCINANSNLLHYCVLCNIVLKLLAPELFF